jgi:hypothetical protein
MALIRGHHAFDDHFTQIPNDWVRDEGLSLEARGLLAQIMSHRPGWNLSIKSLAARNSIGRDKVKRILDELLAHGYLKRSDKQGHDERGHLAGYDYTTCDPGVTQEPCKAEPDKAEPDKVAKPPKKNILIEEHRDKNTIILEPKISKASRMTKLPDDWYPSDRLLEMFATKWPDVDRDYEIEQFINYWHAEGKTKLDWDKAFQVWMARADKQSRGKVAGKRLTNSESAALLAMKYREQAKEIEEPVNYEQVEQIENETNSWFKEID